MKSASRTCHPPVEVSCDVTMNCTASRTSRLLLSLSPKCIVAQVYEFERRVRNHFQFPIQHFNQLKPETPFKKKSHGSSNECTACTAPPTEATQHLHELPAQVHVAHRLPRVPQVRQQKLALLAEPSYSRDTFFALNLRFDRGKYVLFIGCGSMKQTRVKAYNCGGVNRRPPASSVHSSA